VVNNLLKRNASLLTEPLILLGAPGEVPHAPILAQCVPNGITEGDMMDPEASAQAWSFITRMLGTSACRRSGGHHTHFFHA
jgi:hypothetical protein